MLAQETCVASLQELRELIYQTLCEYDQLEPGIFPMSERILVRGSKPCGMLFSVHGPRRVQYTAVWDTSNNAVLCYGSTGQRYRKIQLIDAPELD
jgi:hypothetical protein